MRNTVILIIVLGVVGLIVGYLIFARRLVGDGYIPVADLFSTGGDGLVGEVRDIATDVADWEVKRRNIFISGGVGVVLGAILGLALRRRR